MTSQTESIIIEPSELFIVCEFCFEGKTKGHGIIKCIDDDKYKIILHNYGYDKEDMKKYMIDVHTVDSLKNTFVLLKPYGYNYGASWSFGLYLYNGNEPLEIDMSMIDLTENIIDLTYFNYDFHKYDLDTIVNYINSQPKIIKIN